MVGPSEGWHPQVRKPPWFLPQFQDGSNPPRMDSTSQSVQIKPNYMTFGPWSDERGNIIQMCAAGNEQARKPPASSWVNHKQSSTSLDFRIGPKKMLNLCSKLLPKWIVPSISVDHQKWLLITNYTNSWNVLFLGRWATDQIFGTCSQIVGICTCSSPIKNIWGMRKSALNPHVCRLNLHEILFNHILVESPLNSPSPSKPLTRCRRLVGCLLITHRRRWLWTKTTGLAGLSGAPSNRWVR